MTSQGFKYQNLLSQFTSKRPLLMSPQLSAYLTCVFCLSLHCYPDELMSQKERFKTITDELDQTFTEMSGY